MIGIAGNSVRRIGENLVDQNVAQRTAGESHGYRITFLVVRLDYWIHDTGAAEISGDKDMNLVQTRQLC